MLHVWGCGIVLIILSCGRGVINGWGSGSILGSCGIEGETPVDVIQPLSDEIPSNAEPLKFRMNLAGPPVKPKYSLVTDSGQVP